MSTDETALLAAIAAHPDEDTPRLMLADLYDEWGEPQKACDQRLGVCLRAVKVSLADDAPRLEYAGICERYGRAERGEFIRVQCELAQVVRCQKPKCHEVYDHDRYGNSPVDFIYDVCGNCQPCQRYQGLQRRQRAIWERMIQRPLLRVGQATYFINSRNQTWRRGFVESVDYQAEAFLEMADVLLAEHPAQTVTLTGGQVPWGSTPTTDGKADYYLLRGLGAKVKYGKRVRLPRIGILHTDIIRAVLEAEWPGIKFTLPPVTNSVNHWTGAAGDGDFANPANWSNGTVPTAGEVAHIGEATWGNLAEGPSLAPAINDAAAMLAEIVEQQAAREIAAEREVLSRLVKEYPTREVILARASGPMSFPPSVECNQCGVRTGFQEDDEASTAPSLAGYRVMVAVCAGCRRVYVGVIPHG
jgi:uncharacterized protein (TIGR02996 family)